MRSSSSSSQAAWPSSRRSSSGPLVGQGGLRGLLQQFEQRRRIACRACSASKGSRPARWHRPIHRCGSASRDRGSAATARGPNGGGSASSRFLRARRAPEPLSSPVAGAASPDRLPRRQVGRDLGGAPGAILVGHARHPRHLDRDPEPLPGAPPALIPCQRAADGDAACVKPDERASATSVRCQPRHHLLPGLRVDLAPGPGQVGTTELHVLAVADRQVVIDLQLDLALSVTAVLLLGLGARCGCSPPRCQWRS